MSINTINDNKELLLALEKLANTSINEYLIYGVAGMTSNGDSGYSITSTTAPFVAYGVFANDPDRTLLVNLGFNTQPDPPASGFYDDYLGQYVGINNAAIDNTGSGTPSIPQWSMKFFKPQILTDLKRCVDIPIEAFFTIGGDALVGLDLSSLDNYNANNTNPEHNNTFQDIVWSIPQSIIDSYGGVGGILTIATDRTLSLPKPYMRYAFVNRSDVNIQFNYRVLYNSNVTDYEVDRGIMNKATPNIINGKTYGVRGTYGLLEINGDVFIQQYPQFVETPFIFI